MTGAREDVGALGCTRDGYQLIAVAFLVGLLAASFEVWALGSRSAGSVALSGLLRWIVIGAGALEVIGLAALARWPSGPLPRHVKATAVVAAVLLLVHQVLNGLDRPEDHPLLAGLRQLIERGLLLFGDLGLLLLIAGSTVFCGRARWFGPASLWGLLLADALAWKLVGWRLVDVPSGWPGTRWVLGARALILVVAPLWTAWQLGRYVRGASRQTA